MKTFPTKVKISEEFYKASEENARFPWEIRLKQNEVYDAVPKGKEVAVVLRADNRETQRQIVLEPHYYEVLETGIVNQFIDDEGKRFIAWTMKEALECPSLIHNLFRTETDSNWRYSASRNRNDAVLVEIGLKSGSNCFSATLNGRIIPVLIKWGTMPRSYQLNSFCGWLSRDYSTPVLKQELEDWDSPIAYLQPEDNKLVRYYWLNFLSLHKEISFLKQKSYYN